MVIEVMFVIGLFIPTHRRPATGAPRRRRPIGMCRYATHHSCFYYSMSFSEHMKLLLSRKYMPASKMTRIVTDNQLCVYNRGISWFRKRIGFVFHGKCEQGAGVGVTDPYEFFYGIFAQMINSYSSYDAKKQKKIKLATFSKKFRFWVLQTYGCGDHKNFFFIISS